MSLKAGALGLALSCLSGAALAENVCAGAKDLTALQIAAVQQQLMVAALSCDQAGLYNSFVLAYQKDLLASDSALLEYFLRVNAVSGTADYHRYKTRLANNYSLRSIADKRGYCRSAEAAFAAALTNRQSLAAFALSQPASNVAGSTSCGESVQGSAMVARAPEPPKPPLVAGPALSAANGSELRTPPLPALHDQAPPAASAIAPSQSSAPRNRDDARTANNGTNAPAPNATPNSRQPQPPPLRNYRYDARDYARGTYYGDPNYNRGPYRTYDPYYDYYRWYYGRDPSYSGYGTPPPQYYWRR